MALGPLADFVAFFIAQPFTSGLENRKDFNADPVGQLGNFGVSGNDLGAFLTFDKGIMGLQVLQDLKDNDPALGNADDVRDFGLWLYDFARWEFDGSEEKEYGGVFPGAAAFPAKPEYGNPECQIRKVDVTNVAAGAGGKKQVSLDVFGEGFLKTKTTVNIYAAPKKQGDKPVQIIPNVDPTPQSTFRGGQLKDVKANLASGDYQVGVDIDLGNGSVFTIDTPVAVTKFAVP